MGLLSLGLVGSGKRWDNYEEFILTTVHHDLGSNQGSQVASPVL